MSKTLFVSYRNEGFWAYDVAASILLKHMIDAASTDPRENASQWMPACIERWRATQIVADFGLYLDDEWQPSQLERSCAILAQAESILSC